VGRRRRSLGYGLYVRGGYSKGWRRSKKIALIESANPSWTDLSREWYDVEPADYRRALDRIGS
jgi:hypothetical protein